MGKIDVKIPAPLPGSTEGEKWKLMNTIFELKKI